MIKRIFLNGNKFFCGNITTKLIDLKLLCTFIKVVDCIYTNFNKYLMHGGKSLFHNFVGFKLCYKFLSKDLKI